jgi:N6-adenosine-specific RNA methylase IME4
VTNTADFCGQTKSMKTPTPVADDFAKTCKKLKCGTVLADPPWQFANRTGKMAPEHKRLNRYSTLTLSDIMSIPVPLACADNCHLYLWVPNALLPEGLEVMKAWGFKYKSNVVWHKIRKDGGPDGRGVGFYFRNTTELILFGIRGRMRTGDAGRRQVNIIKTQKREHSRKPDEAYELIESCSPGPYLEMFARGKHSPLWNVWGDQSMQYEPNWPTYKHNSKSDKVVLPRSLGILPG